MEPMEIFTIIYLVGILVTLAILIILRCKNKVRYNKTLALLVAIIAGLLLIFRGYFGDGPEFEGFIYLAILFIALTVYAIEVGYNTMGCTGAILAPFWVIIIIFIVLKVLSTVESATSSNKKR